MLLLAANELAKEYVLIIKRYSLCPVTTSTFTPDYLTLTPYLHRACFRFTPYLHRAYVRLVLNSTPSVTHPDRNCGGGGVNLLRHETTQVIGRESIPSEVSPNHISSYVRRMCHADVAILLHHKEAVFNNIPVPK